MSLSKQTQKITLKSWFKAGDPWVWLNAGGVAISVIAVVGLLILLAYNGLGHFWPSDVLEADYRNANNAKVSVIAEHVETKSVLATQLRDAGLTIESQAVAVDRHLFKMGNRDVTGADFGWFLDERLSNLRYPSDIMVLERREWGNFYGRLLAVKQNDQVIVDATQDPEKAKAVFNDALSHTLELYEKIHTIEKHDIGDVNFELERLRLEERRMELGQPGDTVLAQANTRIAAQRQQLNKQYQVLKKQLDALYLQVNEYSIVAQVSSGQERIISLAKVVRATWPNQLSVFGKVLVYFDKLGEFLLDEPREANTEGGIFPAIFGTVLMVLLMSIIVTPFGIIAAVYLREYAKQGWLTRVVRIAVNNLAGVPSIVYGVFGLGFFVYFLGGHIDQAFYEESLPAPTFGTPGLMWASLTLALLTLPVVIVATEEGLARIPSMVRQGSLALGATRAETLWRVVLPMATPAMMTGLILAIARAAGEVAPLMVVGVVKLAPSLPLNSHYPYLHLDQKFMHLGFHIYDVGFQSPNVEAARPLVYATALLLVIVIALLNVLAVNIRNRLREKYKALES